MGKAELSITRLPGLSRRHARRILSVNGWQPVIFATVTWNRRSAYRLLTQVPNDLERGVGAVVRHKHRVAPDSHDLVV